MNKSSAFTLAEMLITLGVVGVIAAITIPALINNYQKTQYVTALKKSYSTVQNGLKTYMATQNCNDMLCTGLFDGTFEGSNKAIKTDEFKKIFSGLVDLGNISAFKSTTLSGETSYSTFNANYPAFVTADGMYYGIQDADSNNCEYNFPDASGSKLEGYCAMIFVDTNGLKNPNVIGRDVFKFYIGRDGLLYPMNGSEAAKSGLGTYWNASTWTYCGDPATSTINANTIGNGCAARIIEEGWQMNY